MQLYLEHPKQALFWELQWVGTVLIERAGAIGTEGHQQQHALPNSAAAFVAWISAVKAKLEAGYQDPDNKTSLEQLDAAVYEQYLKDQQYDAAIAWLDYFGYLEYSEWEDQLIEHYVEKEDYTAAEKYILGKLKESTDPNLVIRQVRYLTTVNPMLSRFMLGNLPTNKEVEANNPAAYYKELGMAHSKIAFFDVLAPQLRAIKKQEHQLLYLIHLLDTPHDQHPQQSKALERAKEIIEQWQAPAATRKEYYQQLIAGAERIKQTTTAAELKLALQELEKQHSDEEE